MDQMPQVGDSHRRLHVLAGEWIGEERLGPSPWGPGGPAVGRITARGAWTGGTLVFISEGCDVKGRCTYRFEGRDRLLFWMESSTDDGATWQLLLEGDYRRARP